MPRYFEDLEVGDGFESPGRTITEADVVSFAAISGDQELLDFTGGDPGLPPAVPELLIMVVSSGLGFRAPAETPQVLAFMVFDLHIRLPVRVGDTIRCRIRVAGKRSMKDGGVIVEQRQMLNQRGDVVQEAEYKLLVARRPRE
jgi:3-hydroxybutyryl-CoA dehydratase